MSKKKKIKEFDLLLQKYYDKKAYVKIYRTINGKEDNVEGFIAGLSKNFLLIHLANGFSLDGFTVIPMDDFDSIRNSPYERTKKKIFEGEGLLPQENSFVKSLKLKNWTEIISALKEKDYHVIIESSKKDSTDFLIGPISSITKKKVSIHYYYANGRYDKKPTNTKLDNIRILTFDDRYSTIFRKYTKPAK